VYVHGLWSSLFLNYLGTHNLGDATLGYRADDGDPGDVLPWASVRQILIRLPESWTGAAPTTAMLKIQSLRAAPGYFATSVTSFSGVPRVYSFFLNRALGDNGNGDRLTLTLAGAGKGGADLVVPLNVLIGDVDGSGTVLANDFSAVKKRFFKDVRSPTNPADPSVDYNPLYDIDGSGSILAADYSAVKFRFFQALPPPPPAVASATVAIARAHPVTRELFSSKTLLA